MKLSNRSKISLTILGAVICMLIAISADAQLSGFHAAYFQNEYQLNPAMAGLDKGLNLDLGFQKQWTSIPGGPKLQNLTADYNSGNRVGLGLNVSNDKAGLIGSTRIMATYAYHLPVSNNDDKLNFGLSLGINNTYVDYNSIVGDQGDMEAQNYNNRSLYVDGDFGVSYTSKQLVIQGALPNLKSLFFQTDGQNLEIDRATFFSAISYKIPFTGTYSSFNVEPKLAFRGVKGFDNIFDAGVNLDMSSYNFSVSGIYHTNQTITFGLGLNLQTTKLLFVYTNNTGPVGAYANNTFEFGAKLNLFK